jgi:hypothetical protein
MMLENLRAVASMEVDLVLPGHYAPITDPVARSAEILEHHRQRLAAAAGAASLPVTPYEVSLALFGDRLPPTPRRFALMESLAHLEHLARRGRLRRHEDDGGPTRYSALPR